MKPFSPQNVMAVSILNHKKSRSGIILPHLTFISSFYSRAVGLLPLLQFPFYHIWGELCFTKLELNIGLHRKWSYYSFMNFTRGIQFLLPNEFGFYFMSPTFTWWLIHIMFCHALCLHFVWNNILFQTKQDVVSFEIGGNNM